jgi:hypothetical protein
MGRALNVNLYNGVICGGGNAHGSSYEELIAGIAQKSGAFFEDGAVVEDLGAGFGRKG